MSDLAKDIHPVTTLKRDAAELIARARTSGSAIVITQKGVATAVLQDVESYERQRRALSLLKLLAEGERDYEAGRTLDPAKARARFERRLARMRKSER